MLDLFVWDSKVVDYRIVPCMNCEEWNAHIEQGINTRSITIVRTLLQRLLAC